MSWQLLEFFDMSGFRKTLKVNSRYKYKSIAGGLCFLLFFLFALFYFISEFVCFLKDENFKIINMETDLPVPKVLDLEKANFQVAATIMQDAVGIHSELFNDFLDIKAYYTIHSNVKEVSSTVIPYEKDAFKTISYLPEAERSFIMNNYDLNEFVSFDFNKINVGGSFFEGMHYTTEIKVELKPEKQNKQDLDRLREIITRDKPFLSIHYSDAYFDEANFQNKIQQQMTTLKVRLDFKYSKITEVLLEEFIVKYDKGMFLAMEEVNSSLKTKNIRNDFYERGEELVFATITIESSPSERQTSRINQKLPEFISQTTVILTHIFTFLVISTRFLAERNVRTELAQDIFTVKQPEELKQTETSIDLKNSQETERELKNKITEANLEKLDSLYSASALGRTVMRVNLICAVLFQGKEDLTEYLAVKKTLSSCEAAELKVLIENISERINFSEQSTKNQL